MSTPLYSTCNIVARGAIWLHRSISLWPSAYRALPRTCGLRHLQLVRCRSHQHRARTPTSNGGNNVLKPSSSERALDESHKKYHEMQASDDSESLTNGGNQASETQPGSGGQSACRDGALYTAELPKPAPSFDQTLHEAHEVTAHTTAQSGLGEPVYEGTFPSQPRAHARQDQHPLDNAHRACPPVLLTFDAFGTLYVPKAPIAQQYAEIAAQHGYKVEARQVHEAFQHAFKDVSTSHPNYGKHSSSGMSHIDWWKCVIDLTFRPFLSRPNQERSSSNPSSITPAFKDALFGHFASSAGYSLYPDVRSLLDTIGAGFNPRDWPPKRTLLGIISNSDPRVRSVIRSFGIPIKPFMFPHRFAPRLARGNSQVQPAHFGFATLAYDVGTAKPDPRIFSAAARHAQRTLNSMESVARLTRSYKNLLTNIAVEFHHMHVGDDVEKDIVPALDCGWDAVLLDRSSSVANGMMSQDGVEERRLDDGRIYPVIRSLAALPRLLTGQRVSQMMQARVKQLKAQSVDLMEGVPEADEGDVGGELNQYRRRRRTSRLGLKRALGYMG